MSEFGKNLLKLSFALLKHQAENIFGKEALGVAADTLIDIGGENAQASLESVLSTREGASELLKASKQADEYFRETCEDPDLRDALTIPMGDLPSVQEVIAELPASLDENQLLEILRGNLKRDFPNLTNQQIQSGASL